MRGVIIVLPLLRPTYFSSSVVVNLWPPISLRSTIWPWDPPDPRYILRCSSFQLRLALAISALLALLMGHTPRVRDQNCTFPVRTYRISIRTYRIFSPDPGGFQSRLVGLSWPAHRGNTAYR